MKSWVIESNHQQLDGGSMFGNAPKALWSRWVTVDSQNRIPLASRILLIQTDAGKNILFEAGIGSFFEPKLKERYGIVEDEHQLLKNLKIAGFQPHDIDAVVLSHLHFDHAGGLLNTYGEIPRLVFPKAKFYVNDRHWKRAQNPHMREQASFIPVLHQLLKESNRLILIENDQHQDLDFVRFFYSDGHTIGLAVSEIQIERNPVYFVSDVVPGIPWVHLPITMGYDRYPEMLVDEKMRLFEKIVVSKGVLFFTHDPTVAYAHLEIDPAGRYSATPFKPGLRALDRGKG